MDMDLIAQAFKQQSKRPMPDEGITFAHAMAKELCNLDMSYDEVLQSAGGYYMAKKEAGDYINSYLHEEQRKANLHNLLVDEFELLTNEYADLLSKLKYAKEVLEKISYLSIPATHPTTRVDKAVTWAKEAITTISNT
jgi:hypothetical protein